MPLACIYYPVTVLPHWLQYVAWALPPTYVFEGMRALLIEHVFRADLMMAALAINVVLFFGVICDISCAFAQRAAPRLAAPERRISSAYPVDLSYLRLVWPRRYTDLCIDALLRIRHYAAMQKG